MISKCCKANVQIDKFGRTSVMARIICTKCQRDCEIMTGADAPKQEPKSVPFFPSTEIVKEKAKKTRHMHHFVPGGKGVERCQCGEERVPDIPF